jgi:hypothetical protein
MVKCTANNSRGNPCGNDAVFGSDFCLVHGGALDGSKELKKTEVTSIEKKDTFFDHMYDHFCEENYDVLTYEDFETAALALGLMEQVQYDPEVHGIINDTDTGELINIKVKT